MTLARRYINLTFALGKGNFGEDGFDTVEFKGVRTSVTISRAGGGSYAELQLRVNGMSLSDMNTLSTLGKPLADVRINTVTVVAGSEDAGEGVVFAGNIREAWVDMASAPDGVFIVNGYTALVEKLKPIPASSFQGQADVATILAGLAVQMGLSFENNGVQVQLANPYYAGTGVAQVQKCVQAANINHTIDNGVLAIWPKNGSRGGAIPLISPATGLVGYPQHTENGIRLTTLFNPSIALGTRIQLESVLTPSSGIWTVFSMSLELEAETPGGAWYTHLDCSVLDHAPLPR